MNQLKNVNEDFLIKLGKEIVHLPDKTVRLIDLLKIGVKEKIIYYTEKEKYKNSNFIIEKKNVNYGFIFNNGVEFKGIRIGKPKIEWCNGAIEFDQDNSSYDDCFIIELGSVLS